MWTISLILITLSFGEALKKTSCLKSIINGNGWLVLDLFLILIEMIMNLAYVSISFGVGTMITGAIIRLGFLPISINTSVLEQSLFAAIVSTFCLLIIRRIFVKANTEDINKY
ncbi:MAG: hypothetical protein ACJAYN_002597 [Bermanella sp.]|jgi:membrane protein implicated in regulation of membrane protease activity